MGIPTAAPVGADVLSERAATMRESLQKSQSITDTGVSILGSFDHRLSALETAMRPTRITTRAIRIAHENIDKTLKAAEVMLAQIDLFGQSLAITHTIQQQNTMRGEQRKSYTLSHPSMGVSQTGGESLFKLDENPSSKFKKYVEHPSQVVDGHGASHGLDLRNNSSIRMSSFSDNGSVTYATSIRRSSRTTDLSHDLVLRNNNSSRMNSGKGTSATIIRSSCTTDLSLRCKTSTRMEEEEGQRSTTSDLSLRCKTSIRMEEEEGQSSATDLSLRNKLLFAAKFMKIQKKKRDDEPLQSSSNETISIHTLFGRPTHKN